MYQFLPLHSLKRGIPLCGIMTTLIRFRIMLLCAVSVAIVIAQPQTRSSLSALNWQQGYTLVLMSNTEIAAANQARDFVVSQGGRIAIMVPPHVMLGWIPPGLEKNLLSQNGIESISHTPVDVFQLKYQDAKTRAAVAFFNQVASGKLVQELADVPAAAKEQIPLINDALAAPPLNKADYEKNLRPFGVAPALAGNSDSMIGTVAVALFFVESDGSIDPNSYTWNPTDEQDTYNRAVSGLSFWASQAPEYGVNVTFSVSLYSSTEAACRQGYEPILHPSSGDELWINSIMANLGFSAGNHNSRVTAFNTWLKGDAGTDWAYSVFIGHNPPPAPSTFTNGYFAYAYLGGPYTQMLFKNNGWAPEQFGYILAHETGHIFWACDEYYQPGYGGCTYCGPCFSSGPNPRPAVQNGNCQACNLNSVPCLMRSNEQTLCTFTPQQIGWVGDCSYAISPLQRAHGGGVETGTIGVTTSAGNCLWKAVSNAPWIHIDSGDSGTGDGTIIYRLGENSDAGFRTGTILITGQIFEITQAPAPATACFTDDFESGNADKWAPLTASRWQVSEDAGSGSNFVDVAAPLKGVSSGSAAWGDYDNDGDLDILLTGFYVAGRIAKIYRNDNGIFVDIDAPLTRVSDGSVVWGDYDGDGDLDVVLTGNIGQANDSAINIAQIYRNDNGSFVLGSTLTGVGQSASAWGDYDNDGDLDLLVTGRTGGFPEGSPSATVYRNAVGNFVDVSAGLPGVVGGAVAWGDYDNDGDLDILMSGISGSSSVAIFRNNIDTENTTPIAPANLAATVAGNAVTFSWSKSTDNQTASNSLTYNLRLGITPGGVEKSPPMADVATGYHRVMQLGNTNHNPSWTIKNLPKSRFYWSVQAIDNAFAGSAFAPEQTFVLGDTVWPGDTNNDRLVNQADVLPIALYFNKTGPKRDNASIIWKGHVALPWSPEAATYADANGDGVVNQADVLPIGLNWGKTPGPAPLAFTENRGQGSATPNLGVMITGDTNPGQTFWLEIHADSVNNLFGISFELLYAPSANVHLDSMLAGNWLGDDLIFFAYIDSVAGKINLAVTRKAGQGGSDGSGIVARIKMRMSGRTKHGRVTTPTLQEVVANDAAGNPIRFNVINGSIITGVASRPHP